MEVLVIIFILWIIHIMRGRRRKRQPEVIVVVRRQATRGGQTKPKQKSLKTGQMVRKAYHTQNHLNHFFKDTKRK